VQFVVLHLYRIVPYWDSYTHSLLQFSSIFSVIK